MALRRLSRAELREAGYGPRSERFVNTETGETVSRRQAQNVVLRDLGWSSRAEYERVMSDARARVIVVGALEREREKAGRRGIAPGRVIGPQTRLARDLREASRGGWKRNSGGAWSKALISAGMRSSSSRYRVGFDPNSPSRRRRGARFK